MILVANPPFEIIEDRNPKILKPVEILRRSLPVLPNNAFVGLVLPRSFVDGSDYKKTSSIEAHQRRRLVGVLIRVSTRLNPYLWA